MRIYKYLAFALTRVNDRYEYVVREFMPLFGCIFGMFDVDLIELQAFYHDVEGYDFNHFRR